MDAQFQHDKPIVAVSPAPLEPEPLRFGLWELMAVVTAAAVMLGLFRALGIFGALASFVFALALTNWIVPIWRKDRLAAQHAIFDLVWGLVMPVVCLVYDPFVFKSRPEIAAPWDLDLNALLLSKRPGAYDHSFLLYVIIATLAAGMVVFVVIGKVPANWSAWWAGFFGVGYMLSLLIAIALSIPATIGLVAFGIGALGYTPMLSAHAFQRRMQAAGRMGLAQIDFKTDWKRKWLVVSGAFCALVPPALVGLFLLGAVRGPDKASDLVNLISIFLTQVLEPK